MLAAVNDIGREWYVDPTQRVEFACRLERDGHVAVDFVSEIFRHRTRERIWIRENAHVVRDGTAEVLFYEGTVEDITAERATRPRAGGERAALPCADREGAGPDAGVRPARRRCATRARRRACCSVAPRRP